MLDGVLEGLEAVVGSLDSGCGTCSGRTPAPGPTGTGTATTVTSNQPGSNPRHDRSPGERSTPDRSRDDAEVAQEPPSWDDPDYEWTLQRDNLAWRTFDAGMELATAPFKALGKLLGPLGTVATATPTAAEGITNTTNYTRSRTDLLDAIHEVGKGTTTHDDPRLGPIGGGR